MKLRLGIVGLGLIWENIHMPILMDMKEQFEIKAFCVHNEKKIPLWQQRLPGAAAYTDYRRMVQDSSVDAVVVTTPLEMNAEVTLAALEAGKDVFCEKPMAVHVDVADRIMEMEKQTGKTVYVLEQFLSPFPPGSSVPQRTSLRAYRASGLYRHPKNFFPGKRGRGEFPGLLHREKGIVLPIPGG